MALQTVASLGPLYGCAIAAPEAGLRRRAPPQYMGTLYPGLMRLEQRRLVRAEFCALCDLRG